MAGLIPLFAAGAAAAAPRLGGGGTLDVSLTRIVSALLLCLLLGGAAAVLVKRGGGRVDRSRLRGLARAVPARRMMVIEARRISPHADLCLVRCDDDEYLILSSATGQRIVRRSTAPEPGA